MIAPQTDPTGASAIGTLRELGYDYIELSLAHLAELEEDEFAIIEAGLKRTQLPCRACNNFIPAKVRLTGPEADLPRAVAYVDGAVRRAARLGVQTIVFGSAGAKNVPTGFSHELAWGQLVTFLREIGPIAASRGIVIAIEPISRPEANIILTAAEGLRLMHEVDHAHVRLLVDYYHLATEGESDAILFEAARALRHIHVATAVDRRYPVAVNPSLQGFLRQLQRVGYDGGISIEAFTTDFRTDAAKALAALRTALHEVN
jgi:sugar phosphate isomerase/epimerase